MSWLLVFIGGGLGSLCRYGIAVWMRPWAVVFPYATLLANALSCIVLGFILGLEMANKGVSNNHRLLIITGFCGGFSTFSTFSNETFQLAQNGQYLYAGLNILLNLIICIVCIMFGIWLGRSITSG